MKIAFLVLLLASAVFADDIDFRARARGLRDGTDCSLGKDCERVCNWQCYNSAEALCVDGSCYCELEDLNKKKHPK
ncbi:hypothetical protein O3G_MSEX008862 [Manduca sexta]|uniref:Uncharacterized protein n=1 Tax=Manduca sexta TaxID=7130 RepID=A0A921ZD88_MANSE|nr:hypothetical protein O3G_MSEX008862 [Manduca sexta]